MAQAVADKRVAIVTGSSRGIGAAIVRRLAKDGYAVAVNDIDANLPGITAFVAELNQQHGPGTAIGLVADVTSPSAVGYMIEQTVAQLGPLTVMIANAGISQACPILEVPDEDVHRMFDVNFFGVWSCYTQAARQMLAQGPRPVGEMGYRIIGAASVAGIKPTPMLSHYSVSKFAVRGLTQVMAMEMAIHKINVNCYCPGIVDTEMWAGLDRSFGAMNGLPIGDNFKLSVATRVAMKKHSVPEDVANVVGGFLCSKDSEYVTGQSVVVDGGIVFT